jgi:hypothetical protein
MALTSVSHEAERRGEAVLSVKFSVGVETLKLFLAIVAASWLASR